MYSKIPALIRYGKAFRDTYNFLQGSQWWSRDQLQDYQMQQLSKLLHHAYENVPYYRVVFDERGLKPKGIQDFDDLRELPYLTKEIIRKNLHGLMARNIPKHKLLSRRTSGSTAKPLAFYCELGRTVPIQNAFVWAMWNRMGYQFNDKRVNLGFERVNKPGYWWEFDPSRRMLTLSPFHMTEKNLHSYTKKIREFEPKAIKGLPSTITILSDFMQRHNLSPFSSVRVILCESEMLYSWQRETIESALNCRVFSCYGQFEGVALAGECEESNEYHVFPEYGVTEVIGRNGEHVKQEGEMGEIVGTSFTNFAMPFIRYRTGDIAVWTNKRCICGRNYDLLKRIEGRESEFIVSKDGHLISTTAVPDSLFMFNVKQFQYYQEKPGEIFIKIVRASNYRQSDSERIIKRISQYMGDVKIRLELVSHIPRTSRGKYLLIIQNIPIKFGSNP